MKEQYEKPKLEKIEGLQTVTVVADCCQSGCFCNPDPTHGED